MHSVLSDGPYTMMIGDNKLPDLSRAQRSAIGAFTRVFGALWRCAADPGQAMA
jgi:hypothetical protein